MLANNGTMFISEDISFNSSFILYRLYSELSNRLNF